MQEVKTYNTQDLILTVSKSYDVTKLDLSVWDRYLNELCGDRQYQIEAIKDSIIYLAGGKYSTIADLVEENWKDAANVEIKSRFKNVTDYLNHVQLPGKLSANLDLATGTGKSYVIYGIGQIMLGLGLIDKVLVLCPSLTIEKGLRTKFVELSSNSRLKEAIPEQAIIKNPRIIHADQTIKTGDICVENIHAVYESTGSSIADSLKNEGQKTLVLNDESHHIFNKTKGSDSVSKSIKKWKEFLLSGDYGFKYILGFTGTAYIEDDYFNDVIYRYSLRQAVDDRMVKMVEYVSKDDSINEDEKFQKIYDNHEQNKDKYRKVKPLTILVCKDITNAKRLHSDIVGFLSKKESLPFEEVENKVLIVTSHKDHKANLAKLDEVDSKSDSTEWIVSVSMLTEGWDVKNVFQIVPWEDRAFNSKLLIAQVLGRGLRIPLEYQSPQPKVTVFNHDSWSRNIRGLVNEILEIELRLVSSIIKTGDRKEFNFELYNINYEKIPKEKVADKKQQEFDYTKGYIQLTSQVEEAEESTEYTTLQGEIRTKNTIIRNETSSVDEVVNQIYEGLKIRKWEGKILKLPGGSYTKKELPPKEEIKKIIRASMDKVGIKGNRLVEQNKNKILSMFSTLLRTTGKTVVNIKKVNEPYLISTDGTSNELLSIGNLRRFSTVFYADDYNEVLDGDQLDIFIEVLEDENLPRKALKQANQFIFKTPMNLVFTKGDPERSFTENLYKKENAKCLDAWIKSRDIGFYSIEYSITTVGGKHSKQNSFNPDYFIKITANDTTYIVVVEIKSDNDDSEENKAKLKYSNQHFTDLNTQLLEMDINHKYIFHFLSPNSYSVFFDYLRNGKLIKGEFRSNLEDLLESEEQ